MKIMSFIILSFLCISGFAQIDPVTYCPPIKKIKVNPDKCPVHISVSNGGNNLYQARDEIRQMIKKGTLPVGGVSVDIAEGYYFMNEPLNFDYRDSGTEMSPVVYRGLGNVILSGGIRLKYEDFKVVRDSKILSRMYPNVRGKVVSLDLGKMSINHINSFPDVFDDEGGLFELFIGGKRMPLSAWPDNGYSTMKKVIVNGDKNTPGVFIYREDNVNRWDTSHPIWLKGFWRVGWEEPAIKVASIDKKDKKIKFAAGLNLGIGSKYHRPEGSGEEKWRAINLLEEISEPGEWCIDFEANKLYLYPPKDFKSSDIYISQLNKPIISGKGVKNVSFINLQLQNSMSDGFRLESVDHVLIAGCVIKDLAGRGIVLDGNNCGIQSNDMYGLGKGCIVMSGGDRYKLLPSSNYIINNHLHHYGILRSQYSAAIDLYHDSNAAPAVGIYVANNAIHHGQRDAVLMAGNLNVFEYNQIYRCGYNTADVGAFYSNLDWTIRGFIIRYNHIFDTVGGYNPDDGASGGFVYGNVFEGDRTGVWIASGPDHIVKKNIFIKSKGPVYGADDRGVSRRYATNKRLINKVLSVKPSESPWCDYFPEMPELLENHPELPQRNYFEDNIIWINSGDAVNIKMNTTNKNNPNLIHVVNNYVTNINPGFVNYENGDFRLDKSSDVNSRIKSFPEINTSKMGLVKDEYRKHLPSKEEMGMDEQSSPWIDKERSFYFGT